MTGKGQISVAPNRRLRLLLVTQAVWFATICLLGAWWGRLLLKQARRIAELETQLGVSTLEANPQWQAMQRMLFWESGTFFLLLIAASVFLFWLYWREMRRARSLQAFFASVTHELRTPLTSIRLQAESIADRPGADKATATLVQRLLEDTSRLESQVERTLELARVEGGGLVLSQSFRLKPWLEYFVSSWNESHGAKIRFETAIEDRQIQADPSAVQVIVRNLIDNSLRHSGRDADLAVKLSTEERDGWAVLRYTDNGQPFEGDLRTIGKLFEKGARSQGAGVGLYLVSMLMQRMGGRAEFRAVPQLETTLWFKQGGAAHG